MLFDVRVTLSPWMRRLARAPTRVYTAGFGWMFGHRFLVLTHRGRRSGREYRTMLEVVRWDAADYERRNRFAGPVVRTLLTRLAGFRYDGSEPARRRLVQALPLIALTPAPPTTKPPAGAAT